jgi:hypothetical protein
VRAEPGAEVTQRVLGLLTGVPVGRVATREPTLEDAYVELVGQTAESDAAAAAGGLDGVEDEPEEVRA